MGAFALKYVNEGSVRVSFYMEVVIRVTFHEVLSGVFVFISHECCDSSLNRPNDLLHALYNLQLCCKNLL
jgi:hypothetical protein